LDFRIITVVVLLLGALGFAASRVSGLRSSVLNPAKAEGASGSEDYAAPDFGGISRWINSSPVSIANLRGKVVLIDFWTYSCINCIRTLPFLKAFYATYHPFGLEMVGVHSPEFDFEKVESNVRAAVKDHGIIWPVAMDNRMDTWNAYENHYWPHVYLIDRTGRVRFDFIGEGQDEAIDDAIRKLLAQPGVSLPAPARLPGGSLNSDLTPEIYLGYGPGRIQRYLGNEEGYTTNVIHDYQAPSSAALNVLGPDGKFFLAGPWKAQTDDVESGGAGARVILEFRARDVYLVGGSTDASPARYRVLLDGRPIAQASSGEDVRDGVLSMGMRDLYHVVHLKGVETHVLTLVAQGANVEQFTFTFG
jgi:thiol-disulfide isomerase/thioredoxin